MVSANYYSRSKASGVLSTLDENEKLSGEENLSRCNCFESCSQEMRSLLLTVAELQSEYEDPRAKMLDLRRQLAKKKAMMETTSKRFY